MDLRQLNTFLHVAELGSLARASEKLHTAQPALSRQIALLEQELKVALFRRHGRGMVLTAAGETLRGRAGAILRQVEETRADMTEAAGAVRGRVVFGMPPTVGDVLAERLIERFMGLYPAVTLRVVTAFSGYLLDWLHAGDVDIAVLYGTERAARVQIAPMLEENLHFVTPADASGVLSGPVRFGAVAAARLILPGPQHGLRALVEAEARRLGSGLNVVVEADSLHVQKRLVLRGLGSTVLPLPAVHAEVAAGLLRAVPIVQPRLSRRLVVASPAGRQPSNAVRRFAEVLRSEVAEMVGAKVWDGRLLGG